MLFWTSLIHSLPIDLTEFGQGSTLTRRVNVTCKEYFNFFVCFISYIAVRNKTNRVYMLLKNKFKRFIFFQNLRKRKGEFRGLFDCSQ